MNELSSETCKRLLVLFGGGYNSASSVISYFNIMCGLMGKDQEYLKEKDEYSHQKYEKVKNLVSELKHLIKPYWNLS